MRADASSGLHELVTLSYHSEAVAQMSEPELRRLQTVAQARNHAEGVTGLVIYDRGHFFQWLEGPPLAVDRIWASVRCDPRHRAIELLARQSVPARMFGGWDMKLNYRGLSPANPGRAVDPGLDLTTLARLLMAADTAPAFAQLQALQSRHRSLAQLCQQVFEPTARLLGDLWLQDDCSELDVTLALCQMQACLRQLCSGARPLLSALMPAVLIVPQPGERHRLVAALDGELLWQAGWSTRSEFPADDAALQKLLASTWFDVLDLSLSAALPREHELLRLRHTIAEARRASRNPALVVVVGGRVFAEQAQISLRVGADAGSPSAAGVELRMLDALARRLGRPWST